MDEMNEVIVDDSDRKTIQKIGCGPVEYFLSNLAITFIVLKLCGVVSWSWWWVLIPLWGPLMFVIVMVIVSKILN